jgi:hypothetical protein
VQTGFGLGLFSFLFVIERRAVTVKAFTCGLGMVLISVGLLGSPGCGADNEADAKKAAASIGDPGAPKGTVTQNVPPTTPDAYKQHQAAPPNYKQSDAPKK